MNSIRILILLLINTLLSPLIETMALLYSKIAIKLTVNQSTLDKIPIRTDYFSNQIKAKNEKDELVV
jgi:hypothetical protein